MGAWPSGAHGLRTRGLGPAWRVAGSVCPGRCVFATGTRTCTTTCSLCFRRKFSVVPTKAAAPPLYSAYLPAFQSTPKAASEDRLEYPRAEQERHHGGWVLAGALKKSSSAPFIERGTSPKRSGHLPKVIRESHGRAGFMLSSDGKPVFFPSAQQATPLSSLAQSLALC